MIQPVLYMPERVSSETHFGLILWQKQNYFNTLALTHSRLPHFCGTSTPFCREHWWELWCCCPGAAGYPGLPSLWPVLLWCTFWSTPFCLTKNCGLSSTPFLCSTRLLLVLQPACESFSAKIFILLVPSGLATVIILIVLLLSCFTCLLQCHWLLSLNKSSQLTWDL